MDIESVGQFLYPVPQRFGTSPNGTQEARPESTLETATMEEFATGFLSEIPSNAEVAQELAAGTEVRPGRVEQSIAGRR
jgi:hypothetical protein